MKLLKIMWPRKDQLRFFFFVVLVIRNSNSFSGNILARRFTETWLHGKILFYFALSLFNKEHKPFAVILSQLEKSFKTCKSTLMLSSCPYLAVSLNT